MIKIPKDFKLIKFLTEYRDYKKVLLEFDKYINSKDRIREIKAMKTTQYYMVDAIRDVWNRMKKGEY